MSKPSTTLYVSNLNDKIKKEDLRRQLYYMFSLYGKILDVVHTRNPKVRGTAFVVYRDMASSTAALRGLDGEGFFGKTLRVQYANSTSHATIAHEQGPEAVFAIKMGIMSTDERKAANQRVTVSSAQLALQDEKNPNRKRANQQMIEENDSDEDDDEDAQGPQRKKVATGAGAAAAEDDEEEEMAMSEGE